MLPKLTVAFLIVVLALLYFAECKRFLKLTNMVCENLDVDYSNIEQCFMKAVGRDRTQVTTNIKIYKLPITNMTIRCKVKKRGNTLRPIILNFLVNVCDALDNKRNNFLQSFAFNILRFSKYSNVNHSCPINHDVIFDKWELEETHLLIMPFDLGDYVFLTTWIVDGQAKIQVDITFKYYDK